MPWLLKTKEGRNQTSDTRIERITNLDKADPLVGKKSDRLEGDGADARRRHAERVEGRSGVGLVREGRHAVEVNLRTKSGVRTCARGISEAV